MFSKDKIKDNAIITTAAFSPFIACFGLPAWGFWVGWNYGKYKKEKRQLSHGGMYTDPIYAFTTNDLVKGTTFNEFSERLYDGIPIKEFNTKEMYEDCMKLDSIYRLTKNDKVIWKREFINSLTNEKTYTYHFMNVDGVYTLQSQKNHEEKITYEFDRYISYTIDVECPKTFLEYQFRKYENLNSKVAQLKKNIRRCNECLEKGLPRPGGISWENRISNDTEKLEKLTKAMENRKKEIYRKWKEYGFEELTFIVLGGVSGSVAVPTCEWENIRLYKKGE